MDFLVIASLAGTVGIGVGVYKVFFHKTDKCDIETTEEMLCNKIKSQLLDFMVDEVHQDFLYFLVDKMKEYNFVEHPSINLNNKNTNQIVSTNSGEIPSSLFVEINLLEHIANVISEFTELVSKELLNIPKEEKRILGLASLLYNFVISTEMTIAYGCNIEIETYQDISKKLVLQLAEEFNDGILIKNHAYRQEVFQLLYIVAGYHDVDYK